MVNGGGWEDAEIIQVVETSLSTIKKVKTKFIELELYSALKIESQTLKKTGQLPKDNEIEIEGYLETIFCTRKTLTLYDQNKHSFDLTLSYPLNKEFLNQTDLKQKIAQFHHHILQT